MYDSHVQVAVVGAGPTGASCAVALRMHGAASVALIDQSRFPRDKSCGDGIGPGAVAVMRALGLEAALQPHFAVQHLSVSSPSGIRARGPLPEIDGAVPVGYTVPRRQFDNVLVEAALARGAADRTGLRLENAVWDGRRWELTLKNPQSGGPARLTADYLIGADGARSRVRRALGVPMNSDRHTGMAVRIYAQTNGAPFDALQIDFLGSLLPGYGWVFPIDATRANIGVGIDVSTYKRRGTHLKRLLGYYRASLGGDIAYDEDSALAFLLPYGSELPRLAHPDVHAALAGDAASMINPLTGEGIFYGLFAGELLGRRLGEALRGKNAAACRTALEDYERSFRERFVVHFALNERIKRRIESAWLCDMAVNACRNDDVVLRQAIEVMMGDKRHIGLGTLLRVALRGWRLPALRVGATAAAYRSG
jgi:geranylgeranyl reductase family protein